jgi:hypothetical protein
MSKFNTIQSTPTTTALTYEGGQGFLRSEKQELFLLAVTNMVGENTFYEGNGVRDARFNTLIKNITKEDPSWIAQFVGYLRDTLNMRSASLVMAVEYVRAGGPNGRQVVSSACVRADEPAEMLAYFHNKYGRKLPAALKRGIADSAVRLYTERNTLKFDGQSKGFRFADVIELTHPKPAASWQSELFKHVLDKRHHAETASIPLSLQAIQARATLQALTPAARHQYMRQVKAGSEAHKSAFELAMANQWEWAKSWLGEKGPVVEAPGGFPVTEARQNKMGLGALYKRN